MPQRTDDETFPEKPVQYKTLRKEKRRETKQKMVPTMSSLRAGPYVKFLVCTKQSTNRKDRKFLCFCRSHDVSPASNHEVQDVGRYVYRTAHRTTHGLRSSGRSSRWLVTDVSEQQNSVNHVYDYLAAQPRSQSTVATFLCSKQQAKKGLAITLRPLPWWPRGFWGRRLLRPIQGVKELRRNVQLWLRPFLCGK
jgi:hypothetical protein